MKEQTPKTRKSTGSPTNPKVICRTPTPGKKSIRIDKWKYDAVRAAILETVPKGDKGITVSSGLVPLQRDVT